jgi:hypothetical protein
MYRFSWRSAALVVLTLPAPHLLAQPVTPAFGPPVVTEVPGARANGHLGFADVTGDGRPDAVLSDLVDSAIRVLAGTGNGSFGFPVVTDFPSPFLFTDAGFALGDFNSDGRADMVGGLRTSNLSSPDAPNLALGLGDPGGGFSPGPGLNNDPGAPFPAAHIKRGLVVADLNGDGFADILSSTTAYPLFTPFNLSVLPGDGAGHFGAPILSGQAASSAGVLTVVGDIDGDGDLDVLHFADTGSDSHAASAAAVNINDGHGVFIYAGTLTFDARMSTPSGNPRAFLADLNGDGKADLVFYGRPGSQTGAGGLYVRLSSGNGIFTAGFRQGFVPGTSTILVADTNGDRAPDIIRFSDTGPSIILLNDGHAGFVNTAPFPALTASARDAEAIQVAGSFLPGIAVYTVDDTAERVRLEVFPNLATPACPADFNGSGAASVQDIFDYLGAYFGGDRRADFNSSGGVSVQDIFDFLAAYFGGCP